MTNDSVSKYNVNNVYRTFGNVLDKVDNQSMYLNEFVIAFRELAKFFDHLNVIFKFVAQDLVDKFNILSNLSQNDLLHYQTIQKMIEYEKHETSKPGSEALLRLLRALEFIYFFLKRAVLLPDISLSTKQIAWDVYKETLHKRHNAAIHLSVWLATATIPNREILEEALMTGVTDNDIRENCFALIENIYFRIHKLYEENDSLELVPL